MNYTVFGFVATCLTRVRVTKKKKFNLASAQIRRWLSEPHHNQAYFEQTPGTKFLKIIVCPVFDTLLVLMSVYLPFWSCSVTSDTHDFVDCGWQQSDNLNYLKLVVLLVCHHHEIQFLLSLEYHTPSVKHKWHIKCYEKSESSFF